MEKISPEEVAKIISVDINKLVDDTILSIIGLDKNDFGRFRGAWAGHNKIIVYTREGGSNRTFADTDIYKNKYFANTYDDEDDDTYCFYIFDIPEEYISVFP